MTQGPMSGIRVIDLSIAGAVPYATTILAMQGADVIKIERPDGGDFMRTLGAVSNGVSAIFISWNRGKRSICIDIQKAEGAALVAQLVAGADVFVHNLRPGNAEKLGLSYDALRRVKPDLIYAYLTGWGEIGPRAGDPAYDSVVQAAAGIASDQADRSTGEPHFVHNAICDKVSSVYFSQLITAALLARYRTGRGQRVHMSMLHAMLSFAWGDAMQQIVFADQPGRSGPRSNLPPIMRTTDGWMSVSTNLDREFHALCSVLGVEALASDPRYAASGERSRNGDSLWPQINAEMRKYSSAELAGKFGANRIPHSVVNTPESLLLDPQVEALGIIETSAHPEAGRTRLTRPLGDFTETPLASAVATAPRLGEHTDEVLRSIGVSNARIAALRGERIVA